MNTTASSYSSEPWSRRCSTESVYSIQGKETDFVVDTSDTDTLSDADGDPIEYEPVSEDEEDAPPVAEDSSGQSDNDIIATKVIEVCVGDEGELQFADSEQTETGASDSEVDLHDYWQCAQCRAVNNNPMYRYCEKCFKVRKNFFPPRPKRKARRTALDPEPTNVLSQDSGIGSQELSQEDRAPGCSKQTPQSENRLNTVVSGLKRRAESADRSSKRVKTVYSDSDSNSDSDGGSQSNSKDIEVKALCKTVSDPSLTIDESVSSVKLTKKIISNTLKETLGNNDNFCIVCLTEPKSGVFVHGRIAHICCCYKCAVKVWAKAKRCPVCNCKVSNVLKAVVM